MPESRGGDTGAEGREGRPSGPDAGPAAAPDAASAAPKAGPDPRRRGPGAPPTPSAAATIVCAETDPAGRAALLDTLTDRVTGCTVATAASGAEAVALVSDCLSQGVAVPCILSSCGLPDMDGPTLLARVHKLSPRTRTILLAARCDHAGLVTAVNDANLYRYIAKPWGADDLRLAVRAAAEGFEGDARRDAEIRALRESEARLRALVDRAGDGILTIDEAGIIQSANPAVGRLFGYPPEDIVGSDVTRLMQPGDAAGHATFMARYLESGDSRILGSSREVAGRHADGHEVPVDLFINEFRVDDRRYFSGILRDIGPRRRLEQMRVEKDLAEERARAKSAFLATMSHEIRTPMNGVMGMLELLEATPLDGEQRNLLNVCRDSARYLLTIIDDILDFSKIEAGKLVMEEAEVAVDDLVFSVADLLAGRAWDKEIDLVTFVDNAIPPVVKGDPARLRQILINLVGNAIKFTAEGQVSVSVTLAGGTPVAGETVRLRFDVADTGIGIPEEHQARLFSPFEQAEAGTTRRFGGTGLGLAICRRLAEMMDGTISLHSVLGEGSTFSVEVPVPVIEDASSRPDLSGAVIAVAARNEAFLDALDRGLGSVGATVVPAAGLKAAQAIIARRAGTAAPVNLLIVDDGAAAAIGAFSDFGMLAAERFGGVPVLLMARRDRGAISGVQRRTGATWGLTKPARPYLLLQTVAVALGRAAPESIDAVLSRFGSDRESPGVGSAGGISADLPFSGGRVLVAEDTPTSRLVVTKMLQRMGLEPVVTETGAEALTALAEQGPFDLVLTDCHMPEMDGFDLTAAIRAKEKTEGLPHLPVVALSAGVLKEEMDRCFDSGMDDFLAKPVESAKLRRVLWRWLPPATRPRESTMGNAPAPAPDTNAAPAGATPAPAAPGEGSAPEDGEEPVLCMDIYTELFGALSEETLPDVRELLAAFMESAHSQSVAMANCVQAHDAAGLKQAAHRLAGAALSAGAVELGTRCRTLEKAAAALAGEDGDWSAVAADVKAAEAAVARVRDAVAAV